MYVGFGGRACGQAVKRGSRSVTPNKEIFLFHNSQYCVGFTAPPVNHKINRMVPDAIQLVHFYLKSRVHLFPLQRQNIFFEKRCDKVNKITETKKGAI